MPRQKKSLIADAHAEVTQPRYDPVMGVRIAPELQKAVKAFAKERGMTLGAFMTRVLQEAVNPKASGEQPEWVEKSKVFRYAQKIMAATRL